ncbi:hypothetical protein TKWG_12015 [Advenella kashmirensis WT001]|uniref:Uncharacterized protein n=1 Tax=Advenella kashmirensis (strain DSM 17095 / LMG 22695 / WT001) TaxID=1036672 RepID=I3UC45_ADVKW|nr:hypothetical protein [Advenella kashmirensis]AFK62583.1 hypothetical protein TKWG_12015 [Advenella kashmirensis WT001]
MKDTRDRMRLIKYLIAVLFLLIALAYLWTSLSRPHETAGEYSQFDKERAIIACMTAEYATNYTDDPAETDMFPECEARFEKLKATLPYAEYVRIQQTPVSAETGPVQMQPYEVFLQIMTGADR